MRHSTHSRRSRATTEAAASTARPVASDEFDRAMASLAAFGARPRLAAGVSGGADSMALAVLAHDWVRAREGSLTALVVDHGLRPGSAAEAARVAERLGALGIAAEVLRWEGDKRGAQAAARVARLRLLEGWCASAAVPFLLLGHHRDDQAETLLLRLVRGSGLDGLAGMAVRRETAAVALLRPLLGVPAERLRATLIARGIAWEEDPSNRDPAFARVRMRRLLAALAPEGLSAERVFRSARALGRERAALERATLALLAEAVVLDPAGYAVVDLERWRRAPLALGRRALVAALMAVGGREQPPRGARVDRVLAGLAADARPRTLGGCRLLPWRGGLLICRELVRDRAARPLAGRLHWDGRFLVSGPERPGLVVRALGPEGWAELVAARPCARLSRIPHPARLTLPAVYDLDGLLAVPHLAFQRGGATEPAVSAAFRPLRPLGPPAFAFVEAEE